MSRTLSARVAAVALAAAACTLFLAGCSGSPSTDDPAATSTSGSTSSHDGTTPVARDTATPTPLAVACDAVLTTDQLAALRPALTPATGYAPAAGSDAQTAVDDAGTSCGFTNTKTGNVVAVSVATPTASALAQLRAHAVSGSNVVPTYGTPPNVLGYFTVDDGQGVAQVFTGSYWILASSKDWIEPGDAGPVMADVLGNVAG